MSNFSAWQTLHSLRRDDDVVSQRLKPGTVRRVISYGSPYRVNVTAFLIVMVMSSLLVVAQPLLFKRIVDQGISKGDSTVVTTTALIIAGIAVFDGLLSLISRYHSARIGEGLIFDLRRQVYGHVQRQSIAFFTRTQTGALVSRLNGDVVGAQQAFTSVLSGVVGNAISLVVVLVTMLWLSWQITVAALILLPLFLLPARALGRTLQGLTRESMQLNASMGSQMTERFNVAGALLVKLFGRPEEEQQTFESKAGRVRDIGIRIALANRVFLVALTLVAAIATAVTYGIGGNLVINGSLTLGTLLAMTALLGQLYGPLTALSNVRVDVMTALVSFERVFEVLDLPALVQEAPDAVALPPGPLGVKFDNVKFSYPTADQVSLASLESIARSDSGRSGGPVLTGLSFVAEPGTMVALVGPSGAGKTTTTSLVSRLYDVCEGAVTVGGVDVRDATMASLTERIGVVTQDAHMFHDSIRANLEYARPGASDEQLRAALADAQILDLVDALPDGLDTVVGDRGHRLSGGEKQRMAIARLLLKAPSIVVLDEATAHLDSESEAAVQRALGIALQGRTSLVIAHRLSTIRQADQILVVDGGTVVQRGTHDDLLGTPGLYRDLYQTQFAAQESSGVS